MHDNHNDKTGSWMKWSMLICCGLPLVILLFLGFGSGTLGASKWPLIIGVGGMMLIHFLIMSRPRQGGLPKEPKKEKPSEHNHSRHCCH